MKNNELIEIAQKFILKEHMAAISAAAKKGKFCISFREAGSFTINALRHGAKAKGHDILEKTIKPSSLASKYKTQEEYDEKLKWAKELNLIGYVGNWDSTGLRGIYVGDVRKTAISHAVSNSILDITNPENINLLQSQNEWRSIPYTGDYDAHDMITFRGAGRPRTVMVNSKEEKEIIDCINLQVAKVDPARPFNDIEHNVVRHGAQVNFSSYMLSHEKSVVDREGGFIGTVARPGEFPLAVCDRGNWFIIRNIDQLEAFYGSIGAKIKEMWSTEGVRNYHDTENGRVRYARTVPRPTYMTR
ncbi:MULTISPECIES: hypothetical protein [Serratia]|uniref:hypothetical protein n=1 Tax=Serratia TaxID=613 RepID=UPI00067ADE41|nr:MULTISPECIES: hypothetical protein [Serratia]MBL0905838.1 hypothetical protein [Serratia bockelmannii]